MKMWLIEIIPKQNDKFNFKIKQLNFKKHNFKICGFS